jgi:hypothetical protein
MILLTLLWLTLPFGVGFTIYLLTPWQLLQSLGLLLWAPALRRSPRAGVNGNYAAYGGNGHLV